MEKPLYSTESVKRIDLCTEVFILNLDIEIQTHGVRKRRKRKKGMQMQGVLWWEGGPFSHIKIWGRREKKDSPLFSSTHSQTLFSFPRSTTPTMTTHDESPSCVHTTLDVHRGAIDQTTITTQPPQQVMQRMESLLQNMGIWVEKETAFRYRCIRLKKDECQVVEVCWE